MCTQRRLEHQKYFFLWHFSFVHLQNEFESYGMVEPIKLLLRLFVCVCARACKCVCENCEIFFGVPALLASFRNLVSLI